MRKLQPSEEQDLPKVTQRVFSEAQILTLEQEGKEDVGVVPAGDLTDGWIYAFLREQSPGKDERAVCPFWPCFCPSPTPAWPQPGLRVVAPAGAGHALRTQLELPGKDLTAAGLGWAVDLPGTAGLPPTRPDTS